MNRPFAAFGALTALAVLAMFAVSATTRCTTVLPPRSGHSQAGANRFRGANYVLVLPAPPLEDEADADFASDDATLCDPESIESNLGGPLADEALLLLPIEADAQPSLIRPARIELAHSTGAAPRIPSPMDCLSHYDPQYDRIVYGPAAACVPAASKSPDRSFGGVTSPDADLTQIFRSFLSAESSVPQAGASPRRTTFPGLAAVFRRWVVARIDGLYEGLAAAGLSRPPAAAAAIDWADYDELIDSASNAVALNSSATATSDAPKGVRYGAWLRHSAAATLYQIGRLLETAAIQIDASPRPAAAAGGLSVRPTLP